MKISDKIFESEILPLIENMNSFANAEFNSLKESLLKNEDINLTIYDATEIIGAFTANFILNILIQVPIEDRLELKDSLDNHLFDVMRNIYLLNMKKLLIPSEVSH